MLEEPAPEFPFLALLVSGGHSQLIEVAGVGRYRIIGETLDDAAGRGVRQGRAAARPAVSRAGRSSRALAEQRRRASGSRCRGR